MKESKKRTGKDYERLHKWMDLYEGKNHREMNHNLRDIPYLRKHWKRYGDNFGDVVREFLHHVTMDWQDTERKWNKRR